MKITFEVSNILEALLEELKDLFPDSIPINNTPSLEEFRKLQGQQEVIQYIRNRIAPEETEGDEYE